MGILAAHTPGYGTTYAAERAPPDSQMDRGGKLLRVQMLRSEMAALVCCVEETPLPPLCSCQFEIVPLM